MESKAFSWNVRKYKDGDEDAIFELLNLAFGKWLGKHTILLSPGLSPPYLMVTDLS